MAKKVKFQISMTAPKAANPVVKVLNTDPAFRPRKEVNKRKVYNRKQKERDE